MCTCVRGAAINDDHGDDDDDADNDHTGDDNAHSDDEAICHSLGTVRTAAHRTLRVQCVCRVHRAFCELTWQSDMVVVTILVMLRLSHDDDDDKQMSLLLLVGVVIIMMMLNMLITSMALVTYDADGDADDAGAHADSYDGDDGCDDDCELCDDADCCVW